MKKTLTTLAITLAVFGVASAEEVKPVKAVAPMKRPEGMATGTRPMPVSAMPKTTTGSSTLDAQVQALRDEMEGKIKTIRDEYEIKIKALIGNVKPAAASSSKEMREQVRGTSNIKLPQGNAWGFFRRFFGLSKEQN